jgi:glycosyltransferase involved in cell wall biosynthesis
MVERENPRFSILMPTHNRADVIGYAIESVLDQTEKDLELLVTGDGCTDGTAAVVSNYLSDKRVRWFDLPKAPGFGYANRNKVFKKAKGEYIAFAAHDDIMFPDHLIRLGKTLDDHQEVDLVYSRPLWVDEIGMILPSSTNLNNHAALNIFLNMGNTVPASCFIHRRTVFEKIGYWNEQLTVGADHDFWKRVISSASHKNYFFETVPTSFHFKAVWKNEQNWPYGIDAIAKIVRMDPRVLPASFLVKVPRPGQEQEIFWKKMKDDPFWITNLRNDIPDFFDHLLHYELRQCMDDQPKDRTVMNARERGFIAGLKSTYRQFFGARKHSGS